jgi:hypothetical protein
LGARTSVFSFAARLKSYARIFPEVRYRHASVAHPLVGGAEASSLDRITASNRGGIIDFISYRPMAEHWANYICIALH